VLRLRAVVSELGRIEVLSLHGANRTRHIAVAGISDALQGGGDVLKERISVLHSQWASRFEDGGELCVGERDRRHGGIPREGDSRSGGQITR
jgi:hypothetical protein